MEVKKTILIAFSRSGVETKTAPFTMTGRRLFGLDVGDWAIVLLGIALGLLLVLV
jgi:hypothetical protein